MYPRIDGGVDRVGLSAPSTLVPPGERTSSQEIWVNGLILNVYIRHDDLLIKPLSTVIVDFTQLLKCSLW